MANKKQQPKAKPAPAPSYGAGGKPYVAPKEAPAKKTKSPGPLKRLAKFIKGDYTKKAP